MPELPEVQAHAERLTAQFTGAVLTRFTPFNFTALKTALPRPDEAYGHPLLRVDRRGKYLVLRFEPVCFAVHLMQGGRLLVDEKRSAKPRNGQARFEFGDGPALLLTEAGKERRAGVWCVPPETALTGWGSTRWLSRSTSSLPSSPRTTCVSTDSCATSTTLPASVACWPTRSVTGPASRRSR
jgi:formamidopyrimidine-DNA glycosylase